MTDSFHHLKIPCGMRNCLRVVSMLWAIEIQIGEDISVEEKIKYINGENMEYEGLVE